MTAAIALGDGTVDGSSVIRDAVTFSSELGHVTKDLVTRIAAKGNTSLAIDVCKPVGRAGAFLNGISSGGSCIDGGSAAKEENEESQSDEKKGRRRIHDEVGLPILRDWNERNLSQLSWVPKDCFVV